MAGRPRDSSRGQLTRRDSASNQILPTPPKPTSRWSAGSATESSTGISSSRGVLAQSAARAPAGMDSGNSKDSLILLEHSTGIVMATYRVQNGVDPMSEIDPESRELAPQEQNIPAPPPAPEGWLAPPPPYTPPSAAPRPTWGRWLAVGTIVATVLAAGGGIGIGFTMSQYLHSSHATQSAALPKTSEPPTSTAPISPVNPSPNQNGTLNAQAIAAMVDPAIVDINTVIQTSSGSGAAAGTGMIITSSGEVLTNNHVVDGSTSISVTIAGHAGTYTAHVIGVSPTADVALIQIEGVSGLPTVTLADSSSVKAGDPVVAIGNALGAGGTPSATQGQVTAVDQTITASEGSGRSEVLSGLIQEDASISPGDSGGALVNSSGQVIGMITAGE